MTEALIMITSMSSRELYKILTGYDYPHGSSSGWTELKETINGENVDVSKAVDAAKAQEMTIGSDLSKITMSDRFESSDKIVFAELQAESSKKSSDRFESANDIDINDEHIQSVVNNYIKVSLGSSMPGGIPTKERISEYYGNMAKRLDTAYSDGKFTKDEYDKLNKMLEEHMEHTTVCAERKAARRTIGGERGSLSSSAARPVILKQLSMTSEEYMAETDSKISEYVEKYFKIDRASLLAMFNSVRYGK